MIAAVHFRNFRALRSAAVRLEPFNLVIGPNGSGKSSLIQALLRLRMLSAMPVVHAHQFNDLPPAGPQIEFHFNAPFQNVRVTLGCNSDASSCNLLSVDHPPGLPGEGLWADLRTQLQSIRAYLFDSAAMAAPGAWTGAAELSSNGGNLAAVLANSQKQMPDAFARLEGEFCRVMPEFTGLGFRETGAGRVELLAQLKEGNDRVPAEDLSQGTLSLLAILTLAHAPVPPAVVCLEEADRGVHPRMLREVRDALYRLSHPAGNDEKRRPVQIIATTHSPYLVDLFKDHPEEVVLANKQGNAATFERLSERADIMELMRETNLGDLWYSGILGGVPGA